MTRSTCPYTDRELARMHHDAGGCNALARLMNRPASTVHRWLCAAHVTPRPRGGSNNRRGNPGHRAQNQYSQARTP